MESEADSNSEPRTRHYADASFDRMSDLKDSNSPPRDEGRALALDSRISVRVSKMVADIETRTLEQIQANERLEKKEWEEELQRQHQFQKEQERLQQIQLQFQRQREEELLQEQLRKEEARQEELRKEEIRQEDLRKEELRK
ncbi:hypothetical protein AXG93_1593s1680 [Marchantia polymorpha subsp. ruderalis]|uniref:Uncharacterized protein n=3 Tax=Marchantia polymorpha TaxID=3197 RepID=A0A176WMC3_MARPO|nr:hypothetical protein AXG93_1593s1680 [Marchantia polymorpha subsp. ruderalis]